MEEFGILTRPHKGKLGMTYFSKKWISFWKGSIFFKGSIFSKDEDIIKKSLETFKIAYECHNPPLKVQKIF